MQTYREGSSSMSLKATMSLCWFHSSGPFYPQPQPINSLESGNRIREQSEDTEAREPTLYSVQTKHTESSPVLRGTGLCWTLSPLEGGRARGCVTEGPPGRPGRSRSAESEVVFKVLEGSASQEAGNKRRSERIRGTGELSLGEESEMGGPCSQGAFLQRCDPRKEDLGTGNKRRETGAGFLGDPNFPGAGRPDL